MKNAHKIIAVRAGGTFIRCDICGKRIHQNTLFYAILNQKTSPIICTDICLECGQLSIETIVVMNKMNGGEPVARKGK
jgi:hypothetical protein